MFSVRWVLAAIAFALTLINGIPLWVPVLLICISFLAVPLDK